MPVQPVCCLTVHTKTVCFLCVTSFGTKNTPRAMSTKFWCSLHVLSEKRGGSLDYNPFVAAPCFRVHTKTAGFLAFCLWQVLAQQICAGQCQQNSDTVSVSWCTTSTFYTLEKQERRGSLDYNNPFAAVRCFRVHTKTAARLSASLGSDGSKRWRRRVIKEKLQYFTSTFFNGRFGLFTWLLTGY